MRIQTSEPVARIRAMPLKHCDECGPVETIQKPIKMQREGGSGQEQGPLPMYEACPNEIEPGTHVLSELDDGTE